MKLSAYQRMSLADKQRAAVQAMREPDVSCPHCETRMPPSDLLSHVRERCEGPREPGPTARWVTWREAISIVQERTFLRWVANGFIRHRGGRGDREYLYIDIAKRVAQQMGFRRRGVTQ